MQKAQIIFGLVLLTIETASPRNGSIPQGGLPGGIVSERENFNFYFPITTMLIVSAGITLVLWFVRQ
jgi:hypothetical protein